MIRIFLWEQFVSRSGVIMKEGLRNSYYIRWDCWWQAFERSSATLFTDSLTALQLIASLSPKTYHSLYLHMHQFIHQLKTLSAEVHLQWVPSHIGAVGNTVSDRAANETHSHPSPIDLKTDQTDLLTNLRKDCNWFWERHMTDALHYTTLGQIRQDSWHYWWTHSTSRVLDTAVTRLRNGHSLFNAHMHRLGLADTPHCPWCLTQPDTPQHLLLHCPRHHSYRTALLHSLALIKIHRPTVADLLGGSQDPGKAYKTLKYTRVFFQKSG